MYQHKSIKNNERRISTTIQNLQRTPNLIRDFLRLPHPSLLKRSITSFPSSFQFFPKLRLIISFSSRHDSIRLGIDKEARNALFHSHKILAVPISLQNRTYQSPISLSSDRPLFWISTLTVPVSILSEFIFSWFELKQCLTG